MSVQQKESISNHQIARTARAGVIIPIVVTLPFIHRSHFYVVKKKDIHTSVCTNIYIISPPLTICGYQIFPDKLVHFQGKSPIYT